MADPLSDDFIEQYKRGDIVFLSMPRGMGNHVGCYGLMPKKTPDGSRVIRYTSNPSSLLDDAKHDNGPSDKIHLSHLPGRFNDLCCEFNHGIHETEFSRKARDDPEHAFSARMNLAQLEAMASRCGFCSVLAQGVKGWRWIWEEPMFKYRYCDNIWNNQHLFGDGSHMALINAVDAGHFEKAFLPGPASDEEVALYVTFTKDSNTVEVVVQKYPARGMRKMTSLMTLEVFIERGE